jgi:hypothetical protein
LFNWEKSAPFQASPKLDRELSLSWLEGSPEVASLLGENIVAASLACSMGEVLASDISLVAGGVMLRAGAALRDSLAETLREGSLLISSTFPSSAMIKHLSW